MDLFHDTSLIIFALNVIILYVMVMIVVGGGFTVLLLLFTGISALLLGIVSACTWMRREVDRVLLDWWDNLCWWWWKLRH